MSLITMREVIEKGLIPRWGGEGNPNAIMIRTDSGPAESKDHDATGMLVKKQVADTLADALEMARNFDGRNNKTHLNQIIDEALSAYRAVGGGENG